MNFVFEQISYGGQTVQKAPHFLHFKTPTYHSHKRFDTLQRSFEPVNKGSLLFCDGTRALLCFRKMPLWGSVGTIRFGKTILWSYLRIRVNINNIKSRIIL